MTENTPDALEPIKAFTSLSSFSRLPDDFPITSGSSLAARQLTAGDLRRARAALEALPALPGESVTVPRAKTLEWDELNHAKTEIGTYSIVLVRDEDGGPDQLCVELDRPSFGVSFVPVRDGATWDEAKAAAQADFERRILACIEAAPVLAPTADEGGEVAALGSRHSIAHDGFTGTVIGYYERLDGKRGVVLQQDGTKVVHVYGEKWLTTDVHTLADRAEIDRGTAEAADAGTGPVGEAVAGIDAAIAEAWECLVNVDDRTSPEEYPFMCLITEEELGRFMRHALAARPVEEPGEVERLRNLVTFWRGVAEDGAKHCDDYRVRAEAALAETRERLEKVEAALRSALDADPFWPTAARAALTGDAQEGGR